MPGRDAQPVGHLIERQHSPRAQAVEAALQAIFDGKAGDHAAAEWLAVAGHKTARVQDVGNGLIGIFIQQPIDLGHYRSLRYSCPTRKR
jgi:hypothetical protein